LMPKEVLILNMKPYWAIESRLWIIESRPPSFC
jgi:hypothetical protein